MVPRAFLGKCIWSLQWQHQSAVSQEGGKQSKLLRDLQQTLKSEAYFGVTCSGFFGVPWESRELWKACPCGSPGSLRSCILKLSVTRLCRIDSSTVIVYNLNLIFKIMWVGMCMCNCSACSAQKRASNPPEPELQTLVNRSIWAGNQILVLFKSSMSTLSCWAIFPILNLLYIFWDRVIFCSPGWPQIHRPWLL